MDEVDKVELNRPLKKPEKAEKTDRTHAQQLKEALLFFCKIISTLSQWYNFDSFIFVIDNMIWAGLASRHINLLSMKLLQVVTETIVLPSWL